MKSWRGVAATLWVVWATGCLLEAAQGHSSTFGEHLHSCVHDDVIEAAETARGASHVTLVGDEGETVRVPRRDLHQHLQGTDEAHRRQMSTLTMSQYAALPWHNIRIAVEYVDVLQDLQAADPAQAAQKEAMLKNNIIPAVVAKLESVLQVRVAVHASIAWGWCTWGTWHGPGVRVCRCGARATSSMRTTTATATTRAVGGVPVCRAATG